MLVFFALLIIHACGAGTIPATPENITLTFLTPSMVRVSWQTMLDVQTHSIEKYVVTYKPTDDRVVQQVAGNSEAVILDRLSPSTQYSIVVTAIWLGKKYRSRQIVFRTLDLPRTSPQQDTGGGIMQSNNDGLSPGVGLFTDDTITTSNTTNSTIRELPPIRGVEIGIVLIVLMVWAGAIALFFNRWGKIRMLLPYQPDYKHEQLKVPGTGVCAGGVCNGAHSHQFEGSDNVALQTQASLQSQNRHFHLLQEEPSTTISERCTRSRINSAIFVSSEGRGFDSIEFLRRHGSQSVLCRKARSAENITDDDRKRKFSDNRQWYTEDGNQNQEQQQQQGQIIETIELAECHQPNHRNSNPATNLNPHLTSTIETGGIVAVVSAEAVHQYAPSIVTTTHLATVTTANTVVGSISIETPPPHIQRELLQQQRMQQLQQQQSQSQLQSIDQHTTSNSEILVRQKSSTSTTSPQPSPNTSPKMLSLHNVRPKVTTLPTLSISGPSPPHEEQFL